MQFENISAAFERITVKQLITLVLLHDLQTMHTVAQNRNKDLSSIFKQVETLNKTFRDLCGETLVETTTGRGKPVQFTVTGNEIATLAKSILEMFSNSIDNSRFAVGKKITAASTTGMLPKIARIWPEWKAKAKDSFKLQLKQIRTFEVSDVLLNDDVDLVFAGRINHPDITQSYEDLEFLEWSKGHKVILLSNHKNFPNDPIRINDIERGEIPIIIPRRGIINDFVNFIFPNLMKENKPVAIADDFSFGIELLQYNVYTASMLVIEDLADNVLDQQNKKSDIKFYKHLIKGIEDVTISDGVFRKKSSRNYANSHPINVCWEIIKHEISSNSKNTLDSK